MSDGIATKCHSVKRESGENPEQIRCCVLRKESADKITIQPLHCQSDVGRQSARLKRARRPAKVYQNYEHALRSSHCSYECAKVSGQHGSDVSEAFGK